MVFLLASAFYAENMEPIHKMLYCIYISYSYFLFQFVVD